MVAGEVFPTPVGMVPFYRFHTRHTVSFPHARGDGPFLQLASGRAPMFSPRPWGWSVPACPWYAVRTVFPTPVGMVRERTTSTVQCRRFPHARGDGPANNLTLYPHMEFSPRPWGWSDLSDLRPGIPAVFPTPVGMVRAIPKRRTPHLRFPHARGDGPLPGKTSGLGL